MATHTINPRARGTASATNAIMASYKQPEPEVGMGATILDYTDRDACTIIGIHRTAQSKGGKVVSVTVMKDTATRIDANGMSESQDYAYAFDLKAKPQTFTRRKTGCFVKQGEKANGGTHLVIGERDHYVDPSF